MNAVFKNQPLPNYLPDFAVPVVAFHRNAMSTAYDKWLDFRLVRSTSDFSEWSATHNPEDFNNTGTFVNQWAMHLQNFVRPLSPGKKLWRARCEYRGSDSWNCQPLPIDQMGANPKLPASRLNSDGDFVLYCAEAERTAIAEIRPGKGYLCTTCQLDLIQEINVLDIAAPLEDINPFTGTNLTWKLDLRRVAEYLSHTVAEPISRGQDTAIYCRTQFVAFIARAMNLRGIRFSSSLDYPFGVNLAFFDPTVVTLSNPRLVIVTKAEIEYETLPRGSDAEG